MKFETNKHYNGFILIKQKYVKEINSNARLFLHEKSGAQLLSIENDDDNKVFSMSFRTPPDDSTGIFHILEHSVLCGSRKYPVKDPFVELVKGSLNTFLNAMTFADKTMYPVASRNAKDFRNLCDVYLDAVLYPDIYKYKEIFMQEGWHYELSDKAQDITINGVVYNEMKGAFSAPESILFRKIQESLYPDTPYGFESGGDPEFIPDLTYEKFIAFHKKYYHPSNSYIYLYGDCDILNELQFIDSYLKDFDKIENNSKIALQKPFGALEEMNIEYPVSEDEAINEKTFLNLNYSVGKATDSELYLAFEILEHMLLETPAAPLKKALLDEGIGKDVFGKYDNSILQPIFSIVVKNSEEAKKQKFKDIVFNTLNKLASEGIDKELIEASINIKEFELREADFGGYPKGLIYNIKCMDSWLYDEDPLLHIEYESVLEKIKNALSTNYFEELISKYLLNSEHMSLIVLKPKRGLSKISEEKLNKKLLDYKEALNKEQINLIIENTKKLKERQNTPEKKEDLLKLPLLSLADIDKKAEELPREIKEENGALILFHPIFTNKIGYLSLLFNTDSVPYALIPYIGLLTEILGKVDTKNYTYGELSNKININTGGIDYTSDVLIQNGSFDVYHPMLIIKSRALISKIDKLTELIGEIISNTKFDDEKRLLEIIRETKSRIEISIYNQGHVVAIKRMNSYFCEGSKYSELMSGLSYYKFLSGLEKNYESKKEIIKENLYSVCKYIFDCNNLLVSFTSEEEDYKKLKAVLNNITDKLLNEKTQKVKLNIELKKENEGLLTQGKVQYAAKGYNFIKLGYKYSGSMLVLRTLAGYEYLWNKIRVIGGAYGAFAGFGRDGNLYLASYRDPNLLETYKVYDAMKDYLLNFDADEREMTKYIIGTMSRIDSPLTPSMKGSRDTINYISGITQKDIQREREEVLNTSIDNLKSLGYLIGDVIEQNYLCTIGNEAKIKENSNLFNNLINVFE